MGLEKVGTTSKTDLLEKNIKEARKEEEEFRKMLPSTGFINDYMEYTDKQESPGCYHFWVCISLLGAVVQRKVWVSKGMYNVYPSLYTVLVSPTGKCRKSRAVSLGLELIEDFDWINLIADKTTPEALLQALMMGTSQMVGQQTGKQAPKINVMHTDATGIIEAGELAVFLNKQTYTTGMVTILTKLYDCPEQFKYITRNKNPIILKNVMLMFLGGSTPEWLATNLPEAAFEGGFMSRITFIVKFWKDRSICWPKPPEPGEKKALKMRLLEIRAKVRGEMGLTHEARLWFEDWYHDVEKEAIEDMSLSGFIERKPETILKVATLLAGSELRMIIDIDDLKRSLKIVSWTQAKMFKAFQNVDLSPQGQIRHKILEMLDQTGEITRCQVLRRLGGRLQNGLQDLISIENVMVEAEEIRVVKIATGGKGRPSIMYQRLK